MADHSLVSVCILAEASVWADHSESIQKWAQYLKAPLNPGNPAVFQFQIEFTAEEILLKDSSGRKLTLDFDKNHLDYRRKRHQGKNELIAKALGAAKGCRKVLDLSVGLAIDSVFLSQLGFKVQGVERSPVLFALLSEAFARTRQSQLQEYRLYHSDSLQFLKSQKGQLDIDSIYFDPMYPHKKKSALPKQEMVIFRELVGDDQDAVLVLKEALSWPVKRVVVKRPLHAEQLLPGVIHAFEGKVVRYDVYMAG